MSLAFISGLFGSSLWGPPSVASLVSLIYRRRYRPAAAVRCRHLVRPWASGHFLATAGRHLHRCPLCFWCDSVRRKAIGAKRLWLLVPLGDLVEHPSGCARGIATIFICGPNRTGVRRTESVNLRAQTRSVWGALTIIAVGTADGCGDAA